jgi:hypothetical protein
MRKKSQGKRNTLALALTIGKSNTLDYYSFTIMKTQPQKTPRARVRSGRRYNIALTAEHQINPFTHIAHLNVLSDFAPANFKRNLKVACSGLMDAVVFEEVASGNSLPHYHFFIRTTALSKPQFKELIRQSLKQGRHSKKVAKISLRYQKIIETKEVGGCKYCPKSTFKLIRKIELGKKYQRIAFKIGKPFSKSIEGLIKPYLKEYARFYELCNNPNSPLWEEFL